MNNSILIVDDEEHICSILSAYLREQGYDVFDSTSLNGARDQLRNGLHPDLIILDVMLQDGTGIDLIKEIRKAPETKEIPVILMSATVTKSRDKVIGLELGADDYITKPFDLRELKIRMENILKPRENKNLKPPDENQQKLSPTEDISSVLKGVLRKKEKLVPPPPHHSVVKKISIKPALSLAQGIKPFFSLLLEPRSYFTSIGSEQSVWLGMICLIGGGLLRGLQAGVESKSVPVAFVNMVVLPMVYVGVVGFFAWMIQWWMGLRQIHIKFKPLFGSMGLGSSPLVISGLLGTIYVAAGGRAGDFTAGPLLVFLSQGSSPYIGFLLRRLDVFELWSVWLVAMSIHHSFGFSKKKVFIASFSGWIILILITAVIKGLLS